MHFLSSHTILDRSTGLVCEWGAMVTAVLGVSQP